LSYGRMVNRINGILNHIAVGNGKEKTQLEYFSIIFLVRRHGTFIKFIYYQLVYEVFNKRLDDDRE
jgi:hypothetical protein